MYHIVSDLVFPFRKSSALLFSAGSLVTPGSLIHTRDNAGSSTIEDKKKFWYQTDPCVTHVETQR